MGKPEGGGGDSDGSGISHPRGTRLSHRAIEIQAIEPNAILRGDVRIPNYFKDFWQPILGHKAAATYEMILRFAYGERETCTVSLYRLAASLGMTRSELKGRERRAGGHPGVSRDYRQRGTLDALCGAGLLQVQIRGQPGRQSYLFKILRTPPLLTPAQVRTLPGILQRAHHELMERCRRDLEKRQQMQASPAGVSNSSDGPSASRSGAMDGKEEGNMDRVPMAPTRQALPGANGIQNQVPLAPGVGATGIQIRVPMAPRRRHTDFIQPRQRQGNGTSRDAAGGEAIPQEVVVVVKGSIFKEVPEASLARLVAEHGAEKVALYADVLDWQYRLGGRAVKRPFSLLARALRANALDVPADYVPFGERARRAREAEAHAMLREQAVEDSEREGAARRQVAEEAFAAMSEAERDAWWQQAVEHVPQILRGHRRVVENMMFHMIAERKAGAAA